MKLSHAEKRKRNEALTGLQVHSYFFERLLGQGGWGRVYLASDMKSGRQVAVKLLQPELQEHAEVEDEQPTRRFEYEARAAQSVCHPNLIQVLDYQRNSDFGPYLVMEYLAGDTLAAKLQNGAALSPSTSKSLFGQMSEGLAAVHQSGIIYRDLKPSNIYIVPVYGYELVKLLDFGIALLPKTSRLTLKGQVIGTPLYMSPEQILDPSGITAQSDIYSFGVLFYRVMTGQPLFAEKNPTELYRLHIQGEKDLSHPKLSLDTQQALAQILAKEPKHRPATITKAWQLLEASLLAQAPYEVKAPEDSTRSISSMDGILRAYLQGGQSRDDFSTVPEPAGKVSGLLPIEEMTTQCMLDAAGLKPDETGDPKGKA